MHETYATTLAVGSDIGGEEGLAVDHTTSATWQPDRRWRPGRRGSGRFRVDAVLRCLMAPAQLSDLTGRLASIWIADLNHPDGRPDGLALIDASVIETVPAPETFGLQGSPSPPERDRYYSAVAGSLTAVGIPTLDDAAVRRYVEALIDDVVDLAPAMRARISLDDTREEVTDDLQEHARERLYLHTSPLPVELVDEAELPRWAADFARHHPRVGTHTLLVWMPPDQLAKQFTGLPEPGQGQDEAPRLAMLAAGQDHQGSPCARLSFIARWIPVRSCGPWW